MSPSWTMHTPSFVVDGPLGCMLLNSRMEIGMTDTHTHTFSPLSLSLLSCSLEQVQASTSQRPKERRKEREKEKSETFDACHRCRNTNRELGFQGCLQYGRCAVLNGLEFEGRAREYRLDVQDTQKRGTKATARTGQRDDMSRTEQRTNTHNKKKPGHLLLWANDFRQIRERVSS